jgi:hypothetical protein
MKKTVFNLSGFIFLLLLLVVLPTTEVKSQFYFWHPQQALTDSSADNTNPCLVSYVDNSWYNQILVFWERSVDSNSSAIYYRKIHDGMLTDPVELLSAPGIHFTNPKALVLGYSSTPDTVLILLYESDAAGEKDLYYMTFHMNGTFSQPRLLSALPGDDTGLSVANAWNKYVSWQNGGQVFVANYNYQTYSFDPYEVLVEADAEDPSASEASLAWLQQTQDSSKILYFKRDSQSGSYVYTGPNDLYLQGENRGLTECKGFVEFAGATNSYVWQNRQGGNWGIVYADMGFYWTQIYESRSSQYNYHSPDLFDFPIIIKFPTFITFVTDSTGDDEVMTSFPYEMMDIQNQSQYPGPDRNPHFFSSIESYVYQIQLLWESKRNGHWTIFRSHYDMVFGMDELTVNKSITVAPNPFYETTQIKISKRPSSGSIFIYNTMSQVVKSLECDQTDNSILEWDGTDMNGNKVVPGLYFIRSQSISEVSIGKVLKL